MKSVFISSTFRDMQAERDILHERVFPELRRRLSRYGEDLQELDLRWGVDTSRMSEEESSLAVVEVCIDGINRCRPYMVVLLGNRYGWIPGGGAMDQVADSRVRDLCGGGISITQMEIEYGALSSRENIAHSIFCLRSDDLPSAVPGEVRKDYDYEDQRHREKLLALKQAILSRESAGILQYRASWDDRYGVVPEDFEEKVTEALWDLIRRDLPETPVDVFPEEKILRDANARRKQYVQSYRSRDEDRNAPVNRAGAWFYGGPGSGKSALMAKVATGLRKIDVPVFLYFCENAGCGSIHTLLSSLVFFLDGLQGKEKRSYADADNALLMRLTVDGLKACEKLDYAILIDAADRMEAEILDLVTILYRAAARKRNETGPDPFYCILVSSTDDYYRANKTQIDALTLVREIKPLTESELMGVVRLHAQRRAKQIDEDVMDAIRRKDRARNPYYLSLLLQRLFMMDREDFQAADAMGAGMTGLSAYMQKLVRDLPDTAEEAVLGLLDETYRKMSRRADRLQTAVPGKVLARPGEILGLLACSRSGLTIDALSRLLGEDGKFFLPVLMEQLFVYLYDSFQQSGQGVWNFSHRLIRESLLGAMTPAEKRRNCRLLLASALAEPEPGSRGDALFYACRADDAEAGLALLAEAEGLDDTFRLLLQEEEGRSWLSGLYRSGNAAVRRNVLLAFIRCGNLPVLHPKAGRDWLAKLPGDGEEDTDLRYLRALIDMKLSYFDLNAAVFDRARKTAEELHDLIAPAVRDSAGTEELFSYREPVSARSWSEKNDAAYCSNDLKHVLDLEESSYKMMWELLAFKDEALAEHRTEQFDRWHASFPTGRGAWLLARHRLNKARVLKKLGRGFADTADEGIRLLEGPADAVGEDDLDPDALRTLGELYLLKAENGLTAVGLDEVKAEAAQLRAVERAGAIFRKLLARRQLAADLLLLRDLERAASLYFYRTQDQKRLSEHLGRLYQLAEEAERFLKTPEQIRAALETRLDLAEILLYHGNDEPGENCARKAQELWNSGGEGGEVQPSGREDRALYARMKFLLGASLVKKDVSTAVDTIVDGQRAAWQNYEEDKSRAALMQLQEGRLVMADLGAAVGNGDFVRKTTGQVKDFSSTIYAAQAAGGEDRRLLLYHKACAYQRLSELDKTTEAARNAEKIYRAIASALPGADFSRRPDYLKDFLETVIFLWNREPRLQEKTADVLAPSLLAKRSRVPLDDSCTFMLDRAVQYSGRTDLLWNEELTDAALACAAAVRDDDGIPFLCARKVLRSLLLGDAEAARKALDDQTGRLSEEARRSKRWSVLAFMDQVSRELSGESGFSFVFADSLCQVSSFYMEQNRPSPLLGAALAALRDRLTAMYAPESEKRLAAAERFAAYAASLTDSLPAKEQPSLRGLRAMTASLADRLLADAESGAAQFPDERFLPLLEQLSDRLWSLTDRSVKAAPEDPAVRTMEDLARSLAARRAAAGDAKKESGFLHERLIRLTALTDFTDAGARERLEKAYREYRASMTGPDRDLRHLRDTLLIHYSTIAGNAWDACADPSWILRYLEESSAVRGMMKEAGAAARSIIPACSEELRFASRLPDGAYTKENAPFLLSVVRDAAAYMEETEADPHDQEWMLHVLQGVRRCGGELRQEAEPLIRRVTERLDNNFDLIMYVMFEALKHQKQDEAEKDLEAWVRKRHLEVDAKEID